jgi:hypothetical protein
MMKEMFQAMQSVRKKHGSTSRMTIRSPCPRRSVR